MIKFVECLQSISTELKQISVKFRSTDEMVNGAPLEEWLPVQVYWLGQPPEPESPRQCSRLCNYGFRCFCKIFK